jgi:hypothetical protein
MNLAKSGAANRLQSLGAPHCSRQAIEIMRTLIVPDIHNHIENADHWLSSQRFEQVVFLGDYFDNFGDNAGDSRKTALWLRNCQRTVKVYHAGSNQNVPPLGR